MYAGQNTCQGDENVLEYLGNAHQLVDLMSLQRKSYIFEPRHEISNNVACAISKASDQPAHTRSLIRAFASRLNIL